MFLSIIIPVYNVERYISRCVVSCLKLEQLNLPFEIIIVNDGTTDKSIEIIHDLIKEKEYVSVINKSNGGLSSARNAGLLKAKGTFVWFVDSDDWIDSGKFKKLIPILKNKNPDILQFDFLLAYDNDKFKVKYNSALSGDVKGVDILNDKQCSVGIPFAIFKRSFLKENNLSFKEGIYHEDVEFKPKALILAKNVYYYRDVFYYYYQRTEGNIMSGVNLKHALDSLVIASSHIDFMHHHKMTFRERYIFNRKIAASIIYSFRIACTLKNENEQIKILKLLKEKKKDIFHMLFTFDLKYSLLGLCLLISPSFFFNVVRSFK